ncbi:16S rRNA (guanine(527)-N(7))-methyltransferase RsmG [Celeribacter arenosi]|uniref:Ribosomal RNA small subunit methyltransferase G n=1 Tax=Celeribacter arenosi TaxID=792649 RepID=A0ABP7JYZ7_9RHOB
MGDDRWLTEHVSRETIEKLETYQALLEKWSPKINLVAKSTISDAWTRHIVDSAQVFFLRPDGAKRWADIGSGAGFPGLVCAVLAAEIAPEIEFHLIESDQRKCAFLRTVVRDLGLSAKVYAQRIDSMENLNADVVSARALAPLGPLLELVACHLAPSGSALLMKGARFEDEMAEAQSKWRFKHEAIPSKTDDNAVVLRIGDLKRD